MKCIMLIPWQFVEARKLSRNAENRSARCGSFYSHNGLRSCSLLAVRKQEAHYLFTVLLVRSVAVVLYWSQASLGYIHALC